MLDWLKKALGSRTIRIDNTQNPEWVDQPKQPLRPELNPDDRRVLATLMAETAGEDHNGRVAAFNTIQNRSREKQVPWDWVVADKGQYSGFGDQNDLYKKTMRQIGGENTLSGPNLRAYEDMKNIVMRNPADITRGANHYFNPAIVDPIWAQGAEETYRTPGHKFMKIPNYRTPTDPNQQIANR